MGAAQPRLQINGFLQKADRFLAFPLNRFKVSQIPIALLVGRTQLYGFLQNLFSSGDFFRLAAEAVRTVVKLAQKQMRPKIQMLKRTMVRVTRSRQEGIKMAKHGANLSAALCRRICLEKMSS